MVFYRQIVTENVAAVVYDKKQCLNSNNKLANQLNRRNFLLWCRQHDKDQQHQESIRYYYEEQKTEKLHMKYWNFRNLGKRVLNFEIDVTLIIVLGALIIE